MKTIILIAIGIATFAFTASAKSAGERLADADVDRVASAIWRVEGGNKTKFSHGIKSIRIKSRWHAHAVCKRTIRNNYDRWVADGREGEWLVYLANQYCPPSVDKVGNRNWIRNMRAVLGMGTFQTCAK